MGIKADRNEIEGTIALEGVIDVACAADLKAALLTAIGTGPVRISLAAATYLDITALQVLWAAAEGARSAGTDFAFSTPVPEALAAAIAESGFKRFAESLHVS